VIPALDIYRAANLLVKQHGPDAPIHAAMRADAMLEKGDLDGYAVWKRILWAVARRSNTRPRWRGRCGATIRGRAESAAGLFKVERYPPCYPLGRKRSEVARIRRLSAESYC